MTSLFEKLTTRLDQKGITWEPDTCGGIFVKGVEGIIWVTVTDEEKDFCNENGYYIEYYDPEIYTKEESKLYGDTKRSIIKEKNYRSDRHAVNWIEKNYSVD